MNTITEITDNLHLTEVLQKNDAALLYFSHDACNVCKALKPKILDLLSEKYSKMKMFYINTEKLPEIPGQLRVFSVPTISICFEGKETMRFSRNLSIGELDKAIERPYNLMFE